MTTNISQNTNPSKNIMQSIRNFFGSQKNRNKITHSLIYLVLGILSILWIFPIVWLVSHSFRGEYAGPVSYLFPKEWSFVAYNKILTPSSTVQYAQWFTNTFIVAIFTCVISTLMVLLSSYAFSRLRFKGRLGIMKGILVIGMFPGFMAMIAVYFILKGIGLLPSGSNEVPVSNYLFALILVYTSGAALGYYISKGFFDTISKSLDEAAQIDGANRAQIFWHIILPLSRPILIYTALTSFMGPWGDFIFVSVITKGNQEAWSIARGLYSLVVQLGYIDEWFTAFSAGAVIISIPIVFLFLLTQKYYVSGVTSGAVKG